MIVVDASVVADALVDNSARGQRARTLLSEEEPLAPVHMDVEVLSVLRRRSRAGTISEDLAAFACTTLRQLAIERISLDALLPRMWSLRGNITPYDAAYVALAETLESPLWTADGKLARAPLSTCEIFLI